MIPASHLLSGFLAGKLLARSSKRQDFVGNGLRNPIVLVAMAGSIVPDFDVVPGLLFGWGGAGLHRTVTHSIVGSFIQAPLLGGVAYAAFGRRRFWLLCLSALAGLWTHVFWDMYTWGVQLFWPSTRTVSGNLVHEGDFFILAALVLAAGSLTLTKKKWTFGVIIALLPCYLLLNLLWRDQLTSIANTELRGREVAIFSTRIPWKSWVAFSRNGQTLEVHTLRTPFSSRLARVKTIETATGEMVQSSMSLPLVRSFRDSVWFPYARMRHRQSGEVLVVWSDLRDTFMKDELTQFPGIHVVLEPNGSIVTARHQWNLPFW